MTFLFVYSHRQVKLEAQSAPRSKGSCVEPPLSKPDLGIYFNQSDSKFENVASCPANCPNDTQSMIRHGTQTLVGGLKEVDMASPK